MATWYESEEVGLINLDKCYTIERYGTNRIQFEYGKNEDKIDLYFFDKMDREREFEYIKLLLGLSDEQ